MSGADATSALSPDPGSSAPLTALADRFWEGRLAADPLLATVVGDRRFDDRLDDPSPAAHQLRLAELRSIEDATTGLAPDGLTDSDRVTRDALISEVRTEMAALEADLGAWTMDPLGGPQVVAITLETLQPLETPADGAAMVERWRAFGPWFEAHATNLRRAMGEGLLPVRTPTLKVLDQLEGLLASRPEDSPLLAPVRSERVTDDPAWSSFRTDLRAAVTEVVAPSMAAYAALIRDEVLPRARPDDTPGLCHVPGGDEAYRRLILSHTSLALAPEEIHAIGLDEVARIDVELAEGGRRILGTPDLASTRDRLRDDPALHFSSADEVFDVAVRSLERAYGAIGRWFGALPIAPCEVVAMSDHEAPHSTVAYYREPAADGSRPGRYVINTWAPETRPRYEAEALAFHESVPGHHLQIAIAGELADLPAFRHHLGSTAFVEGWGLYTERLAEEMGLYSGSLDRLGVRSYDAWRACRLVVDTGLHALGWTRRAAIDFMLEHTALAENNIINEVDRYIAMPGQALAYKLGQREITRLRSGAERTLGDRFDVRAFHDALLGQGALGLDALAHVIDDWTARA